MTKLIFLFCYHIQWKNIPSDRLQPIYDSKILNEKDIVEIFLYCTDKDYLKDYFIIHKRHYFEYTDNTEINSIIINGLLHFEPKDYEINNDEVERIKSLTNYKKYILKLFRNDDYVFYICLVMTKLLDIKLDDRIFYYYYYY